MAYSRDLLKMARQECTVVVFHLLSYRSCCQAAQDRAALARADSRMRRFHRFQENCIISLSKGPKKLKNFVGPSNICAGMNLTLRLLAEPQRELSLVTSLPRASQRHLQQCTGLSVGAASESRLNLEEFNGLRHQSQDIRIKTLVLPCID